MCVYVLLQVAWNLLTLILGKFGGQVLEDGGMGRGAAGSGGGGVSVDRSGY